MSKLNIPNMLTGFRIVAIPIFIVIYYIPFTGSHWLAAGIFCTAAVTDILDGLAARWLKQESRFGAFLDPVADKLLVTSALVILAATFSDLIITIPAIIIVAREVTISALREWMAEMGERTSVKVNMIGKFKTVMQMAAIVALLSRHGEPSVITTLGLIWMYIALILTIWSMCVYLITAKITVDKH